MGWIDAGEWLEYSVNVAQSDLYSIEVRVASESAGGNLHIEFDGDNVTSFRHFNATGGWQNWTTMAIHNVALSQGQQVMRIVCDSPNFNINYVALSQGQSDTPVDDVNDVNEYTAVPSGYNGLHGYISYSTASPPDGYDMGMGFYSAVWPLISRPLANFQIGLPGAWIIPNNRDNPNTPLCPVGTRARDNWPERGPTWDSVFQTVEGGLGYWQGNRFRYGPPKFSMNGTAQCYDFEIASPGWSFFSSSAPLPDDRLGVAQLSNRILIPPDGLTFAGDPNGEMLGYSWMALPLTAAKSGAQPTGDQSWTCFLNASNFKGPIAYYVPETWSKIAKIFDYPFAYGRGLDARPGVMGGGAMEIGAVPYFESTDATGTVYSKIPQLQFPVDGQGRSILVCDVTYYSKSALYYDVEAWRDNGPADTGRFAGWGSWRARLNTGTPGYDQKGISLRGIDDVMDTQVYDSYAWGLKWSKNPGALPPILQAGR